MIIQVTSSKFNINKKGIGIDVPNLVFKLNLIIDKFRSTWPKPETQDEKESDVPAPQPKTEIEEGDVFILDGTVFAVGHDRLVQIVSETGIFAYKRIWKEVIKPELDFSFFEDQDNTYAWEESEELPENLIEYTPPFEWMKVWRENFVLDRNLRPDYTIKVVILDSLLGFSREIWMKSSKVYYSGDQFSEDELKYYLHKSLCWFYSEIGRTKPKTK